MSKIFSPENTQKHLPKNQGSIGVVTEGSDVGVHGSFNNDFGKPGGWSFSAAGEWFRTQKAKVAVFLNWMK